jgi:hypothetical protein
MGSYIDDSGEVVRRKATAEGGHARDFKELEGRECGPKMAELSRQVERRFPNGCSVKVNDQRLMIINVVTAHDGWTRVVRYRVVGVYNPSGSLKIHRMIVPTFLRMVKDAKPG